MIASADKLADINRAIATCKALGLSTDDLEEARIKIMPEYELDCRIGKAVTQYLIGNADADSSRGAMVRDALMQAGFSIVDQRASDSSVRVLSVDELVDYYGLDGEHPQFTRDGWSSSGFQSGYWVWVVLQLTTIVQSAPVSPSSSNLFPEFGVALRRTDDGLARSLLVVTHPNGGVSEVVVTLERGGELDVNVNASQSNGITISADGEESAAIELEADR
ncbi:hypothetical protein [Nocardia niwae]|uniref:hypothetical protein n=1 Tax=Nocardia niwae TaxID=626084 RepID=UPI003405604E